MNCLWISRSKIWPLPPLLDSLNVMSYVFTFNEAFVPMALEFRGRLKGCAMTEKSGSYAAELPLERGMSFLPDQDSHRWQS